MDTSTVVTGRPPGHGPMMGRVEQLPLPGLDGVLRLELAPANHPRCVQLDVSTDSRSSAERLHVAALATAAVSPDRRALVFPEGAVTYGQLADAAAFVARNLLRSDNWQAADRVLLLMSNSPIYLAAFYGTLMAGGVVVPLPPNIESGRLAAVLQATNCRVVLSDARAASRDINWLPHHSDPPASGDDASPSGSAESRCVRIPGDLAAIFFTSGSSGAPKGVMLTHENLLSNAQAICRYLAITERDRALALLPFYHSFGNSVLQTHLISGGTLILAGSVSFPNSIIDAVREHAATSFSSVPDVFRALLQHSQLGSVELPSLRYAAVAGGALAVPLAREMAQRLAPAEFFVMYGQTEAAARLSYLPPTQLADKCGSIGRGLDNVELQVVDDEGRAVAPGAIGEIRARGPNIMAGYWDDERTTAQILRGGWLYTGDLATVDEEGFVFPRGRANAVLKVSGYRVHPLEVEDVVRREFPDYDPVATAFESPVGTRLALFLVPCHQDAEATVAAVREHCRRRLASHLQPAYVEILTAWPLNTSHKVDRAALSALAAARQSELSQHPHRMPRQITTMN